MSNLHPVRDADRPAPVDRLGGAPGRLGHLGVLRIGGPDAVSFLQGQLSNDTRRLSEGVPIRAAYSSAQGRVLAVLHLLPHSSGILALLPREIVASTADRLRKFVLRAKVKIEDVSDDYAIFGMHETASLSGAGIEAPDAGKNYAERDGVGVGRVSLGLGSSSSRLWVVGPAASLEHRLAALVGGGEQIEHDWRLADIRDGLPQVYAATSELFVAQMLNLDLLEGISFSKGCYTGQEIIARTQNLGRIKRRMFRLGLPRAAWSVGQSLRLTDGRTGRLTELAPSGEAFEALAVLSLDAAGTEGEGEPVSAVELPLPYQGSLRDR